MREDELKAKRWLRELRAESGLSQRELGEMVGRNARTVLNAESETAGWPGGYTLLRMLQELGVVQDAPAPADSPLAKLEAKVDRVIALTTRALELLDDPPSSEDALSGT